MSLPLKCCTLVACVLPRSSSASTALLSQHVSNKARAATKATINAPATGALLPAQQSGLGRLERRTSRRSSSDTRSSHAVWRGSAVNMAATGLPEQPRKAAVVGAGFAGGAAARELAAKGVQVTLFESGRGPGGRASTRWSRDADGQRGSAQWDHGCQYIGCKGDAFQELLEQMQVMI